MDMQVAERNGLTAGTPDLRSVGPLAFGPDGVLFVADNVSASMFAIAVDDDVQAAPDRPARPCRRRESAGWRPAPATRS